MEAKLFLQMLLTGSPVFKQILDHPSGFHDVGEQTQRQCDDVKIRIVPDQVWVRRQKRAGHRRRGRPNECVCSSELLRSWTRFTDSRHERQSCAMSVKIIFPQCSFDFATFSCSELITQCQITTGMRTANLDTSPNLTQPTARSCLLEAF